MSNTNTVEEMIESQINKNSVIVVNIHYSKTSLDGSQSKKKNLPEIFVLDLPERIYGYEDKESQKYLDMIETFVYNTLTKKFQTEVMSAQVWIQ